MKHGLFLSISSLFLLSSFPSFAKEKRFSEILCQTEGYACYRPVAGETWEIIWPEAAERDVIRRLNRLNLKLKVNTVIAYPLWKTAPSLIEVSPLDKESTIAGKHVLVNLSRLAWGAYNEDGMLVNWGAISGGKDWCPDTQHACKSPVGTHTVQYKKGASCKSNKFPIPKGGAPMPYCMFFKGGYALHGSNEVPGYNASHGCIRLFNEDAKWINEQFIDLPSSDGSLGTPILIVDDENNFL